MHEVSLGGSICDYLTGESRERTTYEDLRQALARYLVEERGYDPAGLVPRFPVAYEVEGRTETRDADIALVSGEGSPLLFIVFCPGQINTYKREVTALARLAQPAPCPLAVLTDMRETALFATGSGEELAAGLEALPGQDAMLALAAARVLAPLTEEQRNKESRILHTYTGFLKNCCGAVCKV